MVEPAAPKLSATPLLPMYRPMTNLPSSNMAAVPSAPMTTSCHDSWMRGSSL